MNTILKDKTDHIVEKIQYNHRLRTFSDELSFKKRIDEGRGRLTLIANEVARLAGVILIEFAAATRKIKDTKNPKMPETTKPSIQETKNQRIQETKMNRRNLQESSESQGIH